MVKCSQPKSSLQNEKTLPVHVDQNVSCAQLRSAAIGDTYTVGLERTEHVSVVICMHIHSLQTVSMNMSAKRALHCTIASQASTGIYDCFSAFHLFACCFQLAYFKRWLEPNYLKSQPLYEFTWGSPRDAKCPWHAHHRRHMLACTRDDMLSADLISPAVLLFLGHLLFIRVLQVPQCIQSLGLRLAYTANGMHTPSIAQPYTSVSKRLQIQLIKTITLLRY
jgi:hypothetical protein